MGQRGLFVVAGSLLQGDASPLVALRHGADHPTRPAAGGLPWPCRMVGDVADPPAGGATPRHSRARRGIGPRPAKRARPLRAASKLRPRTGRAERLGQGPGQGPQAREARTPPAARRRDAAAGGAATPGGPSGGRAAAAQAAPQAGQRGAAGRRQALPGRRGGRPHSPHSWGPGRPGAPTPQPARGRSKARPAERPRRGLALLCGRVPPSNGRRRLDLSRRRRRPPPHYPDRRRRAGRAAPKPPRVGRGSGPQAAGGGRDAPRGRGREPPSPALPSAAPSRAGGVWGGLGRGPGRKARPKGRAQTEAATRPRPGARAEDPRSAPPRGDPAPRGRRTARPDGRAFLRLKASRSAVPYALSSPPLPLVKSILSDVLCAGSQCPCGVS